MGKARVGIRLKEAIGSKKSSTNRSGDLVALIEKFRKLQSRLKLLVAALKAHHASMEQQNKTRLEVAKHVASLSDKSPIYDCAGLLPTDETPKDSVCSYAYIHVALARKNKMYQDKYGQFVVEYAMEWEKVVNTRISTSIKKSEVLRRDLDHYQKKVESLRNTCNQTMAKGKNVDPKAADKLKRNDEKLAIARKDYERFASDLCTVIEEVTDRGWKDLHPLLIKLAQFDATLSTDESNLLRSMNSVTEKLKSVAQRHGLKPQSRLKELETLGAEMLTTKGAELSLENAQRGAIMGSDSYDAGLSTTSPDALSPTASWDRGGGGALVTGGGGAMRSRASSQGSASSFPDTIDMLAVAAAAAPAPTLDQVNDATSALTLGPPPRTYSSGSLPPLPPAAGSTFHRTWSQPDVSTSRGRTESESSFDLSVGSSHSQPLAPAPAAPPPPPPPVTGLSMYVDVPVAQAVPAPVPMATAAPLAAPNPFSHRPRIYGSNEVPGMPSPSHTAAAGLPPHPWSTGLSANPFDDGGGRTPTGAGTNPFGSEPDSGGRGAGSSPASTNPFDD